MRLATYEQNRRERFGLVLRHPLDGRDWVFDPNAVEAAARSLPALKGAGYTWWRPPFGLGAAWPNNMAGFLALDGAGMDAARRMQDFLLRYLEQSDPSVFADAGAPVVSVALQAPVPEPLLLLGVVGNNPGFLRMDPARGRNLQQPKCHQRTHTSIIGPGQPVVLPSGGERWAGTTELGVIIGRGGREIPRQKAREHIAGYTVINDGLGSLFARRWAELDKADGGGGSNHYHSANTASWLDKKSDTMLAMGPWLVTPEEVGDPYDLLAYYRENGVTRSRGHTGALCCGVEELIHWLSQFLTLEPGMVLHLGATGQDGLPAGPPALYGPEYHAECEIERIGVLRNPIVVPSVHDWRPDDDRGRTVHAVPVARKLVAEGRTSIRGTADWKVRDARHFWTLLANAQEGAALEHTAPRPYPLVYNAPAGSLTVSGGTVVLPPVSRTVTGVCELAVVIRSITREVAPADAPRHILGFVALAVLRDSSFAEALVQPHPLQAQIPGIYCRWPEGFNIVSAEPVALDDFRGRRMRFAVAGVGEVEHSTDAYLLDAARVLAELSRGITLLPGDVIALGLPGHGLEMPAGQRLPENARLTASIDGVGEVSALIADRRQIEPTTAVT